MTLRSRVSVVAATLLTISLLALAFWVLSDTPTAPLGDGDGLGVIDGGQVVAPETTLTDGGSDVQVDPSTFVAAGPPSHPELWMLVALVVLSVTTLAAVAISFYLYRWRKILLANPHLVIPEKIASRMRDLGDTVARLDQGIAVRLHRLDEQTEQSSQKIEVMTDTFMTLNEAVDARDGEIRRLKTGYDAEIFRRFLMRFIRVDRAIQGFLDDEGEGTDSLKLTKRLLEDALDECGVESFDPEVGEDYRAMGDEIADHPKEVPTTDADRDFQVAEIVERGYRMRGSDSPEIVSPAKIRIYKHET